MRNEFIDIASATKIDDEHDLTAFDLYSCLEQIEKNPTNHDNVIDVLMLMFKYGYAMGKDSAE